MFYALSKYFRGYSVKVKIQCRKKKDPCEQDSNLRGNFPLDFESNALTTRPS